MNNGVEYKFVASSNIRGVGYDEVTSTLHVEFTNGSRYAYSNVPKDVHDDLMTAGSPGQYFAENIKQDYPYTRV